MGKSSATPAETPAETPTAQFKARVLVECVYGKPNDIALLTAEELAAAKALGSVDDTPEAVSYAESLTKD